MSCMWKLSGEWDGLWVCWWLANVLSSAASMSMIVSKVMSWLWAYELWHFAAIHVTPMPPRRVGWAGLPKRPATDLLWVGLWICQGPGCELSRKKQKRLAMGRQWRAAILRYKSRDASTHTPTVCIISCIAYSITDDWTYCWASY